jgi:hypothetical protein
VWTGIDADFPENSNQFADETLVRLLR